MNTTARSLLFVALVGFTAACSKSSGTPAAGGGGGAKITKDSVEKAQDTIYPPLPVAEAKAKIVAVLGEPTAVDGEDLYWAAVDGDQCVQLRLMVQKGEAKGAMGGSINKMMGEKFAACAGHVAK